ncbi:hypothetical protein [Streptomyces sp. TE33382]
MTGVLTTDHPAWIETEAGGRTRAVRTTSGIWVLSWDGDGLHMRCAAGTEDAKPTVVATDPAYLPSTVPEELKVGLLSLGPSRRLANPWLWDAITTAILRQVIRAGQARKLYRAWCLTYGTPVDSPHGRLAVAPTAQQVLALDDAQFAGIGAKFHRIALRAAADHYERHADDLAGEDATGLVTALTKVPRIGPWTAAAAATDYTGDFSVYPHDDLAVRTWAAQIAPTHSWPVKEDKERYKSFGSMWAGMAGHDRTTLHTLTLSTLTWGSHAR